MSKTFVLSVFILYSCYLLSFFLHHLSMVSAEVVGLGTVESITDLKQLKKVLKVKSNVLIVFLQSEAESSYLSQWDPILNEVAANMIGRCTIIKVTCSKAPKTCKHFKVNSDPVHLQHFKDGKYNKDYDRLKTAKSLKYFLENPTGEIPWEEDTSAQSVVHLTTYKDMVTVVQRSQIPILAMFYAPWCGHCNRLKPEFSAAAEILKGSAVLAAMDADREENSAVRQQLNITGYPTIFYIENGNIKFSYGGGYTKDAIVEWMKNPRATEPPKPEIEWSSDPEAANVKFIDDSNFEKVVSSAPAALVMFYAPWCGHCKSMKPAYNEAATELKNAKFEGILVAIDASKHREFSQKYKVTGFPTLKYFEKGEYKFDSNARTKADLVDFMKNPKEPSPAERPWSQEPNSHVKHVETDLHDLVRKVRRSLVMFYVPWCGHCQKTKPEYSAAAARLAEKESPSKAVLVAVNCLEAEAVCTAEGVTGYPTIKHYRFGKNAQDYSGGRTADEFFKFMTTDQKVEL